MFRTLEIGDIEVADSIMTEAYARTLSMLKASSENAYLNLDLSTITMSGLCLVTASIAANVANESCFKATLEVHPENCVTNFAQAGSPSEADPIMCLTWGQFMRGHTQFQQVLHQPRWTKGSLGYFGRRQAITDLIPLTSEQYYRHYAPDTVLSVLNKTAQLR